MVEGTTHKEHSFEHEPQKRRSLGSLSV